MDWSAQGTSRAGHRDGGTLALGLAGPAAAADKGPTVVELFTSQSCCSCPPAEAFLGELSARSDLDVLEFNVEY